MVRGEKTFGRRRLDEANRPVIWRPKDNLRLRARFGYEAVAAQLVVGVPKWFMRRRSRWP